jgi:hypothetical protein
LTAAHRPLKAEWIADNRFVCVGRLRRPHEAHGATERRGWLRRHIRKQADGELLEDASGRHVAIADRPLPVEGFRRELTFDADAVRIIDELHVALGCDVVMFAAEPPRVAEPFTSRRAGFIPANASWRVEGGRNVRVVRVFRNGRLVDEQVHRR